MCIVNPNNRMLLASLATGCNRIYCIDLGERVRASDFLQLLKVVSRVVSPPPWQLWQFYDDSCPPWLPFLVSNKVLRALPVPLTWSLQILGAARPSLAKLSSIYHPLMPSILDSCSFHFLSLLSKWKWNSCRLYKPTLWQIPNIMHAMASCIVRGFFRHAVKTFKAKTQRGREKNKGLWCGARTKTPDAAHALLYLFKLNFEHTQWNMSHIPTIFGSLQHYICLAYQEFKRSLRRHACLFWKQSRYKWQACLPASCNRWLA